MQRIIVHDLPRPKRSDPSVVPVYSDIESPINGPDGAALRAFFRERIVTCAQSAATLDVVFAPNTTSTVPDLTRDWLAGTAADFVAVSQHIGAHLHACQTGNSPAGLLAIVDCRLAATPSWPALAILKLERDQGVRLEPDRTGGHVTFNIRHVQDLMLTEGTRVFKLAIFAQSPEGEILGIACDQQQGYRLRAEVAAFFLSKFLGCQPRAEPAVVTKRFQEAAQAFINTKISDQATQASAIVHLTSELLRDAQTLSPQEFAVRSLPVAHRQPFLTYLQEHEVGAEPFRKDTSAIASHLRHIAYSFASGIALVGTPAALEERVQITPRDDGVHVEFDDQLQGVKARA